MKELSYLDVRKRSIKERLSKTLLEHIKNVGKEYDNITIICIGTDRLAGDSYGPITGELLSNYSMPGIRIYGTLQKPIHALTLDSIVNEISDENTLCIAVDCAVGMPEHVGFMQISYEPVRPGSGVGKKLPAVGDISITGIVASGGLDSLINLKNAPTRLVSDMAKNTCSAIKYSYKKMKYWGKLRGNTVRMLKVIKPIYNFKVSE